MNLNTQDLWKWQSFHGWLTDISVNSLNEFAAIGQGGKIMGYDNAGKRWKDYPGNKKGGISITLLQGHKVFVCFKNKIEMFTPKSPKIADRFEGVWKRIQGCCRDIDSSDNDEIIIIGCKNLKHGHNIQRNLGGNYQKWADIWGQAVRIGVGSEGHIVVSNKDKDIFWKKNINAPWIKTPGKAHDVSVSVGGVIVVIGTDQHVYYSTVPGPRPQFVKNNGMGYRVSCWSWRSPMVVGMDHAAFRAELNGAAAHSFPK